MYLLSDVFCLRTPCTESSSSLWLQTPRSFFLAPDRELKCLPVALCFSLINSNLRQSPQMSCSGDSPFSTQIECSGQCHKSPHRWNQMDTFTSLHTDIMQWTLSQISAQIECSEHSPICAQIESRGHSPICTQIQCTTYSQQFPYR